MSNDIRVIGHRGAAAYAPENTLVSFQAAIDLGCKFIEFDVTQSVDGELFVFHDTLLSRTTNGVGNIAKVQSGYIKKLDAGSWFSKKYIGEGIPTLKDAIFWSNQKDVRVNIEIKPSSGQVFSIARSCLSLIKKHWSFEKELPLISSLNYHVLQVCRKLDAQIPLAFVINAWPRNWLKLMESINCKTLNINRKIADKRRVKQAIEHGITVNIFTVNRRSQAKKFFNWGVTSVFSDHPDLLKTINISAYFKNYIRYGLSVINNHSKKIKGIQ